MLVILSWCVGVWTVGGVESNLSTDCVGLAGCNQFDVYVGFRGLVREGKECFLMRGARLCLRLGFVKEQIAVSNL